MKQIIEGLKSFRPILEEKAEPHKVTGFYAFFVISNNCFSHTFLEELKQGTCIYIGIAENETLYERVFKSHLKDTGKSTFRRSMGAVLRNELCLQPIKRGVTATRSNISNYTFNLESEKRLTNFMYQHLWLAFYPYSDSKVAFEEIEKQLIKEFGFPAFNLEYGNSYENVFFQRIKQARKECRDIVARQIELKK